MKPLKFQFIEAKTGELMNLLGQLSKSREAALAITKLEECYHWVVHLEAREEQENDRSVIQP